MHPNRTRPRVYRSKTDPAASSYTYRECKQSVYNNDQETDSGPWHHMVQNFAWVAAQEIRKQGRGKTEKWVTEEIFVAPEIPYLQSGKFHPHTQTHSRSPKARSNQVESPKEGPSTARDRWEELMLAYKLKAERWMQLEEEARQRTAEREKERARYIREEIRRFEAARAREAEWRRHAEQERTRMLAAMQEQERRERMNADKAMMDAWQMYEEAWNTLSSTTEPLTFASVPWPLLSTPSTPANITSAGIVMFLFSPVHSQGQSRKERIRNAQLRWHPDRFGRVMGRICEDEKQGVAEGVGIVARCLNDLMAREAVASRHE